MTTELLEANRKTHWQRVQIKGVFKRAQTGVDALNSHIAVLADGAPDILKLSPSVELVDIYNTLRQLEARASKLLEDAYAQYRVANPPQRDRRRGRKHGS